MTTNDPAQPALDRRHLLRGGTILAGAAGITALGAAALTPTTASAANLDPVKLAFANSATNTTTEIAINSGATPTLTLTNPGGPSLRLNPVTSYNGELRVGEILNQNDGPYIGVDVGDGPETVLLATEYDLLNIGSPIAVTPERLLDTRSAAGRTNIVASSPSALDSSGRLKGGSYIDVGIGATDEGTITDAAFLNVTVVGPLKGGFVTVYPPGDLPNVSTVNFSTGQVIANGAFVAVAPLGDSFAVRVYSSATTHVLLDLTGVVQRNGTVDGAAAREAPRSAAYRRRIEKMKRSIQR